MYDCEIEIRKHEKGYVVSWYERKEETYEHRRYRRDKLESVEQRKRINVIPHKEAFGQNQLKKMIERVEALAKIITVEAEAEDTE